MHPTWPSHRHWMLRAGLVSAVVFLLAPGLAQAQRIPSRFFTQSSSWYMPVPATPVVHANSAAIITTIVNSSASLGAITTQFAVPIYYASAGDPTVTVSGVPAAATNLGWHMLKIPTNAKQSGFGAVDYRDGHMIIVSPDRSYVTDFYQASKNSDTSWSAAKIRRWPLAGTGMNSPYDALTSTRLCATTSLAHGVITYEEIQRGVIDHAVQVAVNTQAAPYFAPYPCEASLNGNSPNANAPQAGMRLQLNPSVDVEALSLNNTSKIVARAIRDYGMIVVDQAGASDFDVYFEDLSFRTDGASWATVGAPALGNIPRNQLRVVESPFVADPAGFAVTTTAATPYYWTPFDLTNFFRGTIASGTTGTRLSQPVTISGTTWWFVDYPPESGHTYGWSRAADFTAGTPVTPPPSVGLQVQHTCGTAANTLSASVLGSIFYLLAPSAYNATALAQSTCASGVTFTDVASILQGSFSSIMPFHWLGTAGPNTSNTCTNCLSVHQGTASTNASGSGWTLDTFREGTTASAATGGPSVWTLLPGLCTQVVDGVVTGTPLWPWPMNQRIMDAMALAGRSPVDVTATMQSLFGTIPAACSSVTPPVTCPPDCPNQDIFVVAPASASPPGVDSNACTLAAPCLTINRARSLMTSGDTLYLRGGTYTGALNRIATSTGAFPAGASWDVPTRIAAYAGETVVLQQTAGTVITLNNPTTDRYLVLDRLTCDGAATAGNDTQCLVIGGGAHHIRVQNGTLRNSHFDVVTITDANTVEILDTVIHSSSHGLGAFVGGTSDTILFDGVTFYSHAGHGLNAAGSGLSNLTVKNSVSRNNVGTGFQLGANRGLATNLLAYGNALGLRLASTMQDGQVYHVTLADNTGTELQIDTGATNTSLTNVIAVGGITDGGMETVQTTNLTTDPGFVGGGNYHMALDTSPAIDEGTCLPGVVDVALDGVARPQPPGGACDIGVYEQIGDDPPPLPTPGTLSASPAASRLFFVP